MVKAGSLPNESYRMVTWFGDSAAPLPASNETLTAKVHSAIRHFIRFTNYPEARFASQIPPEAA